jgi:hypothetical protein
MGKLLLVLCDSLLIPIAAVKIKKRYAIREQIFVGKWRNKNLDLVWAQGKKACFKATLLVAFPSARRHYFT